MEVIEVAGKLLGLAVADLGAESASEDEDTCWSREGSGASYEGGASEDDDGAGGKRKRMSADDRKARNRERNRLHARKTRQRKKQHVQELQLKIWGLRQERQRLLQLSTEHRTAGVLLALSCSSKQCVQGLGSPGGGAAPRSPPALKLPAPAGRDWARELASHEEALRKITQEFESMDGSQQVGDDSGATFDEGGGGGRGSGSSSGGGSSKGSRGGKGTLADRTALRRERNRMHAKRTRNRKKLFVEACSVMIDKMKVENAQLEYEILASGVRLPQDVWADEGQETVPEEPLPEYLAALWDFAEGKTHSPKPPATGPATPSQTQTAETTTPTASFSARHARQTSSSSSSSSISNSSFSSTSTVVSNANYPALPSSPQLEPASSLTAAAGLPGQALEDASTLCAFMEVAQTRAAKRTRVRPTQADDGGGRRQQPPRVWSDHGSTTSESRGSLESDEEAANERKGADRESLSTGGAAGVGGGSASSSSGGNGGAVLSPAFWTSRQVLERYALPRQVC